MTNPYSATTADLLPSNYGDETYEPRLLEYHGRIGRVRYMAYLMGLYLLFMGVAVVCGMAAGAGMGQSAAGVVIIVAVIPLLIGAIVLAKRRMNDLDHSGWMALLMLVPFIGFVFALWIMFGKGTQGANSYGAAPGPNLRVHLIGAWALPAIAVIGIAAAVAIPQYQKSVNRAKAEKISADVDAEVQAKRQALSDTSGALQPER